MNNLPLEIEYKFLIEMPDSKLLLSQPGVSSKHLTQMYLELPHGIGSYGSRCRIRRIEENGKVKFVKTFKRDVVSDSSAAALTRIEIEDEITENEYNTLSEFIRKGTAPIEKERITFMYEGHLLEVDIFPFWNDKAFLEIEVENENIVPKIPEFIKIIKDVSLDGSYRNASIAARIFEQSLT